MIYCLIVEHFGTFFRTAHEKLIFGIGLTIVNFPHNLISNFLFFLTGCTDFTEHVL